MRRQSRSSQQADLHCESRCSPCPRTRSRSQSGKSAAVLGRIDREDVRSVVAGGIEKPTGRRASTDRRSSGRCRRRVRASPGGLVWKMVGGVPAKVRSTCADPSVGIRLRAGRQSRYARGDCPGQAPRPAAGPKPRQSESCRDQLGAQWSSGSQVSVSGWTVKSLR